jgi:glucose/arabinose dehydrogenase
MEPMRKAASILVGTILLALALSGPAGAGAGAVHAVQIGHFDAPVYVAAAPGAKGLLFVVEQPGTIRVKRSGRTLARPFLDIKDLVSYGNERGLLSVAFPPDYERSRRFYVYFNNKSGDVEIDEFKRAAHSQTHAVRSSRRTLLTIAHRQADNHNGGQLQFGPDGYLYAGTGDGGGAGDQFDNASKLDSLLGKLLRIDPTPGKARNGHPYKIPPGNPYVGKAGADEIYSYGLRNPWRFSFDGDTLTIGDVGQGSLEEVDILGLARARGANFGWPEYEGTSSFDPSRPGPDPPTFPVFQYSHGGGNCAITGGYVVHDPGLPALAGRYIYADFCGGSLRSFAFDPATGAASGDAAVGVDIPSPSSFGEGAHNRIYVTSLTGPVYRLAQ